MGRPPSRRRRSPLRIIALVFGGLIVVVAAGITIFVATFDPNSYKPQIIAAVQSATGRELTIGGRISLSLSLQPTLEMTEVSFSNPPGFSRPQMATLQRLQLQLALIPLLSKQIRINKLVLVKPDILLERTAQGQTNWQLVPAVVAAATPSPTPPPPPPPGSAAAPPPSIALSSLRIEGGTLALRDATGKTTTLLLNKLTATAASPEAPVNLTLDASYNGAPVTLSTDTGPLAGLLGGAGAPWPVKFAATIVGAKITADGTVAEPVSGRGLAIAVSADIPDLAALSPLVGFELPPIKGIKAQLKVSDIDGGAGYGITDLVLSLPNADFNGSASFHGGARPAFAANLSAKQIDLDALSNELSAGPAAPGQSPAAAPGVAQTVTPTGRSGHLIPDTKLPVEALRQADGDIQLAVDDLRTGGQDYKAIKLHAVDKGGHLTLDPVAVDVPGGQLNAKLTLDANPTPPTMTFSLQAPSLALQTVLKSLGKPGYASGTLELRADLSGTGDTPHAIAASLNGPIGIAVPKGSIDSKLLGGMMSQLVQQTELNKLANVAGMSTLNCFALRIDATHGVGTVSALQLDTSTISMTGGGTVNFGTETLNLHLKPTIGVAGTNIATPVIVRGSITNPSIEPDAVGTVTGNAGTAAKLALGASTGGLALIIGSALEQKMSGDSCAAPLALARLSSSGSAAAATQSGQASDSATPAPQPQPKPANPLGVLKKLFQ
jgi:uncharacterized protein involved in outer membrane biogenesis